MIEHNHHHSCRYNCVARVVFDSERVNGAPEPYIGLVGKHWTGVMRKRGREGRRGRKTHGSAEDDEDVYLLLLHGFFELVNRFLEQSYALRRKNRRE